MIICEVNKNHLNVRTKELLTAGSQNVNTVEFRFNTEWHGLDKTATFKTSRKTVSVRLAADTCNIPWEVLADAGEILAVGVFGVSGETVVLPTVWGILGKVMDAAHLGEDEQEPTPDIYQQILDRLNSIDNPNWGDVNGKPFESLAETDFSVDDNGEVHVIGGGGGGYLPVATDKRLGGVKVGGNLDVTDDGTLSAEVGTADFTEISNLEIEKIISNIGGI